MAQDVNTCGFVALQLRQLIKGGAGEQCNFDAKINIATIA
jgi:hypothetical protein